MSRRDTGRSSPGRASPLRDRGERQERYARLLRRALDQAESSPAVVCDGLGVSETMLAKYTNHASPTTLQASDVEALPLVVARRILDEAADAHGWAVVERPDPAESTRGGLRRHARLVRELADVTAAHAEALADGHLTAEEAEGLRREIDEALAELLALRELCRSAERERVIGLGLRAVDGDAGKGGGR